MRICIVGLGLIGGSLAYALKGFAEIIGVDTCTATRESALSTGAVSRVFDNTSDGVQAADITVFCLHPDIIPRVLNGVRFKSGSIVTDVSGVKVSLGLRELLPDDIDYIPCHPMAGKETGGFANADGNLFKGTGFIITPPETAKPENIELIKQLAVYAGVANIAVCTPEHHDKLIAYTSQLCHLTAAALCMDIPEDLTKAFTGGAFRDCTRIANMDAELWTSLILRNKTNVLNELSRFQSGLEAMKAAVESGDRAALSHILESAGNNKRRLL